MDQNLGASTNDAEILARKKALGATTDTTGDSSGETAAGQAKTAAQKAGRKEFMASDLTTVRDASRREDPTPVSLPRLHAITGATEATADVAPPVTVNLGTGLIAQAEAAALPGQADPPPLVQISWHDVAPPSPVVNPQASLEPHPAVPGPVDPAKEKPAPGAQVSPPLESSSKNPLPTSVLAAAGASVPDVPLVTQTASLVTNQPGSIVSDVLPVSVSLNSTGTTPLTGETAAPPATPVHNKTLVEPTIRSNAIALNLQVPPADGSVSLTSSAPLIGTQAMAQDKPPVVSTIDFRPANDQVSLTQTGSLTTSLVSGAQPDLQTNGKSHDIDIASEKTNLHLHPVITTNGAVVSPLSLGLILPDSQPQNLNGAIASTVSFSPASGSITEYHPTGLEQASTAVSPLPTLASSLVSTQPNALAQNARNLSGAPLTDKSGLHLVSNDFVGSSQIVPPTLYSLNLANSDLVGSHPQLSIDSPTPSILASAQKGGLPLPQAGPVSLTANDFSASSLPLLTTVTFQPQDAGTQGNPIVIQTSLDGGTPQPHRADFAGSPVTIIASATEPSPVPVDLKNKRPIQPGDPLIASTVEPTLPQIATLTQPATTNTGDGAVVQTSLSLPTTTISPLSLGDLVPAGQNTTLVTASPNSLISIASNGKTKDAPGFPTTADGIGGIYNQPFTVGSTSSQEGLGAISPSGITLNLASASNEVITQPANGTSVRQANLSDLPPLKVMIPYAQTADLVQPSLTHPDNIQPSLALVGHEQPTPLPAYYTLPTNINGDTTRPITIATTYDTTLTSLTTHPNFTFASSNPLPVADDFSGSNASTLERPAFARNLLLSSTGLSTESPLVQIANLPQPQAAVQLTGLTQPTQTSETIAQPLKVSFDNSALSLGTVLPNLDGSPNPLATPRPVLAEANALPLVNPTVINSVNAETISDQTFRNAALTYQTSTEVAQGSIVKRVTPDVNLATVANTYYTQPLQLGGDLNNGLTVNLAASEASSLPLQLKPQIVPTVLTANADNGDTLNRLATHNLTAATFNPADLNIATAPAITNSGSVIQVADQAVQPTKIPLASTSLSLGNLTQNPDLSASVPAAPSVVSYQENGGASTIRAATPLSFASDAGLDPSAHALALPKPSVGEVAQSTPIKKPVVDLSDTSWTNTLYTAPGQTFAEHFTVPTFNLASQDVQSLTKSAPLVYDQGTAADELGRQFRYAEQSLAASVRANGDNTTGLNNGTNLSTKYVAAADGGQPLVKSTPESVPLGLGSLLTPQDTAPAASYPAPKPATIDLASASTDPIRTFNGSLLPDGSSAASHASALPTPLVREYAESTPIKNQPGEAMAYFGLPEQGTARSSAQTYNVASVDLTEPMSKSATIVLNSSGSIENRMASRNVFDANLAASSFPSIQPQPLSTGGGGTVQIAEAIPLPSRMNSDALALSLTSADAASNTTIRNVNASSLLGDPGLGSQARSIPAQIVPEVAQANLNGVNSYSPKVNLYSDASVQTAALNISGSLTPTGDLARNTNYSNGSVQNLSDLTSQPSLTVKYPTTLAQLQGNGQGDFGTAQVPATVNLSTAYVSGRTVDGASTQNIGGVVVADLSAGNTTRSQLGLGQDITSQRASSIGDGSTILAKAGAVGQPITNDSAAQNSGGFARLSTGPVSNTTTLSGSDLRNVGALSSALPAGVTQEIKVGDTVIRVVGNTVGPTQALGTVGAPTIVGESSKAILLPGTDRLTVLAGDPSGLAISKTLIDPKALPTTLEQPPRQVIGVVDAGIRPVSGNVVLDLSHPTTSLPPGPGGLDAGIKALVTVVKPPDTDLTTVKTILVGQMTTGRLPDGTALGPNPSGIVFTVKGAGVEVDAGSAKLMPLPLRTDLIGTSTTTGVVTTGTGIINGGIVEIGIIGTIGARGGRISSDALVDTSHVTTNQNIAGALIAATASKQNGLGTQPGGPDPLNGSGQATGTTPAGLVPPNSAIGINATGLPTGPNNEDKNNNGANTGLTVNGVVVGNVLVPLPHLEIFDGKTGTARTEQVVNDTLVHGTSLPPLAGIDPKVNDLVKGRGEKQDPGIPNLDSNLTPLGAFADPKRFEGTAGMTSNRFDAHDDKELPVGHRIDRTGEPGQTANSPVGTKSGKDGDIKLADETASKKDSGDGKNEPNNIKIAQEDGKRGDNTAFNDDTRNQILTVLSDGENLSGTPDKRTVKDFIDELLHHTKRRSYRIDSGDTLEKLARRLLKDKRLAALIYLLNEDILGNQADLSNIQLRPGAVLTMPSIEDVLQYRIHILHDVMPPHIYKNIVENPDERIVGSSKLIRATYSCRFGDRLTSVAARHAATRDEKLWTLVAQLNGLSLETDRNGAPLATLKRAQKLILPSRKDVEDHYRKTNMGRGPSSKVTQDESSKNHPPVISPRAVSVGGERPTVNWGDGNDAVTPLSALAQKLPGEVELTNRDLGPDSGPASGGTNGPNSKGPKSKPRPIAPNEARIVAPEDLGDGAQEIFLRLEFEYQGKWLPVIEYTGTSEQIYLHVYTLSGRSDSIPIALPTRSIRELAECDLGANYQRYCQKFLAGDKPI